MMKWGGKKGESDGWTGFAAGWKARAPLEGMSTGVGGGRVLTLSRRTDGDIRQWFAGVMDGRWHNGNYWSTIIFITES